MEELPTSPTGPPIKSNATKKREARVAVIREEPHSSSYPLLRTSSVDSPSIVLPRPRTRSASTSTSMRSSVRGAPPRKKPGQLDGDGRKRKISPQQNFQDKTNAVTVTASGMRAGRPPLARQVSTSSTCKRKIADDPEMGGTPNLPTEEDEDKKRLTLIFGIVGATLFLLAVLMVAIGLRMSSPSRPDTVRKENELQTSIASNGVDLGLFNVTTPLPPPSVGDHLQNASASAPPVGMLNATRGSGAT